MWRPPASTVRTSCSGAGSTRRRPAPATFPASKSPAPSRQVGERVSDWRVGDRVCALVAGGGYATLCVAPAPQCLPLPRRSTWSRRGDSGDVLHRLDQRLRARPAAGRRGGAFHGGTSGIGTTAIQLAAARGARVFATAGSDEKCRACEALGAERAINYRTDGFRRGVRDADRRPRRRSDARHRGRRAIRRRNLAALADRRAPRADRLDGRRAVGADRSSGASSATTDDDRIDAPSAHGRGERARLRRRCGGRCGRCSSAAP